MLSFDGERKIRDKECDRCRRIHQQVTSFVLRDATAYAICYASLHRHDGAPETWLDITLGSWGEDDPADHVTFGCRVGPIAGQAEPAASLVRGGTGFSDSPLFGRKLSRDEALVHPWLPQFWEVVDFVLTADPDVHAHAYATH